MSPPAPGPRDDAGARSLAGLPSHEATYRVRFDEAGPDGLLRTSGLLRYGQDIAWQHSEALGFDRTWYRSRGLGWVLRAAEIEVLEPISFGAQLHVRTEVAGWQRIWARRRGECRLADGRLAARVLTDWVLIDGRNRPTRVPAEIVDRFPAPILPSVLRVRLPAPASEVRTGSLTVRPHELDPMNHVNSSAYLDWVEEALLDARDAARIVAARPRTYRLEYAAAAGPGDPVTVETWRHDGGAAARLTASNDSVLLRAVVAAGGNAGGDR